MPEGAEQQQVAAPETAVTAPEVETAAPEQKPQEPPKTFTQDEVDAAVEKRLAKERRKREREIDRLRAELEVRTQPPREQPTQQADAEPKREAFESYEDYLRALGRFEARLEAKRAAEENGKRAQLMQAEAYQRQLAERFQKQIPEARKKYADFDEVVESAEIAMTPVMQRAIMESDMVHDVNYFLAKNPAEAERISVLPPLAQVREIGRIEAKLASAPAPVVKPSSAPEPITPVKGASTPSGDLDDKIPIAEWRQKFIKSFYGRR